MSVRLFASPCLCLAVAFCGVITMKNKVDDLCDTLRAQPEDSAIGLMLKKVDKVVKGMSDMETVYVLEDSKSRPVFVYLKEPSAESVEYHSHLHGDKCTCTPMDLVEAGKVEALEQALQDIKDGKNNPCYIAEQALSTANKGGEE